MKNTFKTLTFGLFLALAASTASHAQSARTWVSSSGNDSSVCSRTAPCLTFAGALAKTTAGGEIDVVDAGDYGHVTITQSVTIDGTGTQASIVVSSGAAITIPAGSGTVILRHLTLTGLFGSNNGVILNSGNLVVDNCNISGFSSIGFDLNSTGNSVVTNTTVTGCGEGIVNTGAGLASLRNVTLQGNQYGLNSEGGAADISHSLITQNTTDGLLSYPGNGTGIVSASDCMISGNRTGVYADTGGLIRLTNNDLFNNTTGINTTSGPGTVSTTGNNRKAGNGTPGAPTPGRVIVQQ